MMAEPTKRRLNTYEITCDCEWFYDFRDPDESWIEYCPKHASADMMHEALKRIELWMKYNKEDKPIRDIIRAATAWADAESAEIADHVINPPSDYPEEREESALEHYLMDKGYLVEDPGPDPEGEEEE